MIVLMDTKNLFNGVISERGAQTAGVSIPSGMTVYDLLANHTSIQTSNPTSSNGNENFADRFCRLLKDGPGNGCRFVVHINRMDELAQIRGKVKDYELAPYLGPDYFSHFLSARLEGNDANIPSLAKKHAAERSKLEEGLLLYTDSQNSAFAFTPIDFGLRATRRRMRLADG